MADSNPCQVFCVYEGTQDTRRFCRYCGTIEPLGTPAQALERRLKRNQARQKKLTQFVGRALVYVDEIENVLKSCPADDPSLQRISRAAERLRHNMDLALTPFTNAGEARLDAEVTKGTP
jgi:hypothetical protein